MNFQSQFVKQIVYEAFKKKALCFYTFGEISFRPVAN